MGFLCFNVNLPSLGVTSYACLVGENEEINHNICYGLRFVSMLDVT